MARGLNRQQIGVTNAMVDSYGDLIFQLSHNMQTRRGDPIRELDFAAIEASRAELGMSDGQIAARVGLSEPQVMYIRNMMERRNFNTRHFQRLLELGGGKRFREERFTNHADRFEYHEDAIALREAMTFAPDRARHYAEQGWWADDTMSGWLAGHVSERPDAPAIIQGDLVINYADLGDRVDRLAGGLHGLGLGQGDVIAVQLPNIVEYLVSYLAIARLGAVMTTLYMPHRAREFETLLGHSRARALICLSDAGGFPAAETALGLELPKLQSVIAIGAPISGAVAFEELAGASASADKLKLPLPVAADPFLLLYTSGTTASPKAVPHNSHTMLGNARLGAGEHQLTANDVIVSAPPFGHLFALYSFHLALYTGAANLLLANFTPPDLAATVETGKATALFTAPAHMAACLGMGLFDKHDWSSLTLAILSGSAVPADMAHAVAAKIPNCAITQLWGMTETQGGLYSRPGDGIDIAAGSAGHPAPGAEARISDEGELQVRGSMLFPSYFDNPGANDAAFTNDGWFRSGDLAAEDDAGNIAITGRIKDIINRGGVKYNPREIEDLLDGHPEIVQSAIVPMPDDVLGERACCFAVATDKNLDLNRVCAYLLEKGIAKTKLPERLVLVDEMPMTPTRKIIKGRLILPELPQT
ncbi:MAG: class I adenylate-forming enzyme family protein [Alphaproteobacteria bacterium]|nr:class I adenylate-forming enzyme family protein [Alphaproteobacteria bacterium]